MFTKIFCLWSYFNTCFSSNLFFDSPWHGTCFIPVKYLIMFPRMNLWIYTQPLLSFLLWVDLIFVYVFPFFYMYGILKRRFSGIALKSLLLLRLSNNWNLYFYLLLSFFKKAHVQRKFLNFSLKRVFMHRTWLPLWFPFTYIHTCYIIVDTWVIL